MLEIGGSTKSIPPCGAGKGGCYFLNDQKVTKESLGPLPVSTLPAAVLTVIAPRPPFYGGRPPGRWSLASGGSEHKTVRFSCLGDTGPFVVAKSALFRTPKCGHPSCRSLAPPLPTKPASLGFHLVSTIHFPVPSKLNNVFPSTLD